MDKIKLASHVIIALLIFAVLILNLVPVAFSGMLIYLLTDALGARLRSHVPEKNARIIAAVVLVLLIIALISSVMLFLSITLGSEENLRGFTTKIGEILFDLHRKLPPALVAYLPETVLNLKESFAVLLSEHGKEIGNAGKESLHTLAHVIIAVAIGIILSMENFTSITKSRPLAFALHERMSLITKAFSNVVFAQVKISGINTILTSIFLLVVLPFAGIHMPYRETLVLITFLAGLIPVLGNLISNTCIVVISIGVSFNVTISALIFLVCIHKLEYFINAKIVGTRIQAKAWELLLAMLVMESIFGLSGLLMGPILYAYIKSELIKSNLI